MVACRLQSEILMREAFGFMTNSGSLVRRQMMGNFCRGSDYAIRKGEFPGLRDAK